MLVTGISSSADARSPTTSLGMSAPSPLPNPLRRATTDLLGQFPVGDGAAGGRVEHDDGLTERRGLRESNGAGNNAPTDPIAKVLPHLGDDLLSQPGAGVVHGQDDGGDLESR